MKVISAFSMIFFAFALSSDRRTSEFPSISSCFDFALASAFAYSELLIDSQSACKL
jgi:hypothetical protein